MTSKETYQKRKEYMINYNKTHKELVYYRQMRSRAKQFIRTATQEDLQDLRDLLNQYLK